MMLETMANLVPVSMTGRQRGIRIEGVWPRRSILDRTRGATGVPVRGNHYPRDQAWAGFAGALASTTGRQAGEPSVLQFTLQPGTRNAPVAIDRAFRNAKQLGDLRQLQPGKIMQLDDFGSAPVDSG
jgi:hypothetical protein